MTRLVDRSHIAAVLFSAGLCWGATSTAQAGEERFLACAKDYPDNSAARLKCYDDALAPVPAQPQTAAAEADNDGAAVEAPRSYLTRAWNLDDKANSDESKLGRLRPYRQSYLVVRKSSNPNNQPGSVIPGHSVAAPGDLDALEAKFLLSFKADIGSQSDIDFLGLKTLRLWGAYTQQSNWQVFNTRNSSPFRETNYQPELIATFGTGNASGLKMINLGLEHQSNGRPLPESRSWNRVYLQGGWEWNNSTSILVRGWWRLPENQLKDDNPDINDYIGRADIVARWEPLDKSQAVAILLRDNLRMRNRGFVQIDWALPFALGNAARIHAQLSSGYGESLIDYNHRQTTFGLGFSFREW